jgi:hypothetical protein
VRWGGDADDHREPLSQRPIVDDVDVITDP